LTFGAPEGSHDKILTPKKSQVNMSLRRFLKHKITQNMVFINGRVITEIGGSIENPHKSLQIMIITTNNIIVCRNVQ
jgi:hypothetical protein